MDGEPKTPSVEAELMNIADDITYSVHDLEDFFRAGRIPLQTLAQRDGRERRAFFEDVFRRNGSDSSFTMNRTNLEMAFTDIVTTSFWLREPYAGTKEHRAALRGFTGELIDRFIRSVQLRQKGSRIALYVDQDIRNEIEMFKQLVWTYVINAPALATQQIGQGKIIKTLFVTFKDSAQSAMPKLFPPFYRERLDFASSPQEKTRITVDFVASLTEAQCVSLFQRVTGSVRDYSADMPSLM